MRRTWVVAILLGLLPAVLPVFLGPSGTGTAVAAPAPDVGAGPCGPDVGDWTIVQWYQSTGSGPVPMRCGNWDGLSGWGYRKAVALGRSGVWYEGMTGAVLSGFSVDVQGTTHVYRSQRFVYCDPEYRFVVVVQTRTFGHDHMRGIITAHKKEL